MQVQVLSCAIRRTVFRTGEILTSAHTEVNFLLVKIIDSGRIGGMRMVITNRDQRPKRYTYEAVDIEDMIGNVVTSGRIRQLARGHAGCGKPIGWMQFKAVVPDDGKFQLPFPVNHVYSAADVAKLKEFIDKCALTDRRYTIKMNRWYCQGDIPELIKRSKRLTKTSAAGDVKESSTQQVTKKRKIAG